MPEDQKNSEQKNILPQNYDADYFNEVMRYSFQARYLIVPSIFLFFAVFKLLGIIEYSVVPILVSCLVELALLPFYKMWFEKRVFFNLFFVSQLILDTALISVIVWFSGGSRSVFFLIYLTQIYLWSNLGLRYAFVTFAASAVFYLAIFFVEFFRLFAPPPVLAGFSSPEKIIPLAAVFFFLIAALETQLFTKNINKKLVKAREKVEKLLEEYTAMMAHEMRAPIEGIRKVSEVLMEEKVKKDEKTHDDFVRMITSNATVMLQLINDYLDAAKLEAGKLEVSPAEFDFKAFIEERIMYFRPLAQEKKFHFVNEFSSDLPTAIFCDKIRLTQVFNNLLSNAVKFGSPEGEIRIQALIHKKGGDIDQEAIAGKIHWFVSGKEPVWKEIGDSFVGAVTDTGRGMAEQDIPKLFTKFTQLKTSGRKGTGLGLFIVKGIIEAHGGRVGAASKFGAGSTFFFTLPLK